MIPVLKPILQILLFPAGLFLVVNGLVIEWIDRKLVARLQNRIGPRWFQPLADIVKLLAKEEILPSAANPWLFVGLPMIALAGCLTAALYVPLMGLKPAYSFSGDLIVTLYLLSLLTLSKGLAGWNTSSTFSLVGATRGLTQLFAYEAPFLLALLGPAIVAGSWQIDVIMQHNSESWIILTQPIGFLVALIGLMGKLELPPFDAPEAETEIVSGATTDYSGRGLAVFNIAKSVEFVIGLALIATLYLGGLNNPLEYILKTFFILIVLIGLQTILARLRIDQTVGVWWRYGVILVLVQWMILIIWKESLLL